MKKLLTLTMVLALTVAFTAGCKKKTEEPAATPAAPATSTEAPKPIQAPMSAKAATPAPEAPKAPEKK